MDRREQDMIIRYQYVTAEGDGEGCPFCGDEVRFSPAPYESALPHFYCDRCKVEFTIEERYMNEEEGVCRNFGPSECLDRWNTRKDGAKGDECPFCGGRIEEWPWGHYLFDSLYCPNCKKRFQFQSHPHGKRSIARTMREFGKRPK